ncbi:MAG: hypothetical protein JXC85_03370 [Candidatus Aenigmarchaeota archaeon]|nr:hypothetical protein [Candidatus Aenigmarchaeota archaeon]
MVSPARMCLVCKGSRRLCGLSICPVMSRFSLKSKIGPSLKESFFGQTTSVFIGHYNYPNVFVGPLAPLTSENISVIDDPSKWFGTSYSSLVEMRSSLLRSKEVSSVYSRARTIYDMQEIAMASRPPDVEMRFKGKPVYRVSFSDVTQPMGPTAKLLSFSLGQNVRVPARVEKVVSDDLKARDASFQLYLAGQDVYKISTILSSGALGVRENRKLVPTRWSITASQTTIADMLIGDVKKLRSVNDFTVFSSAYLDNHFVVLLMPGNWEFENFEAWAPGTPWSMNAKRTEVLGEYEPHGGRTSYAELQGGGFYASRLGVAEGLLKMRRQARVVVFREVHEGYVVPLGVWQVLENVRNAFRQRAEKFDTKEGALRHVDSLLRLPISDYVRQSVLLKQKRLEEFMK